MFKSKKNNKGFTLVELIVVIVILAILAAILVPALLGYIDRAKESQIVLNAKSCLTASQAEMSNLYGKDKPATDIESASYKKAVLDTADVKDCQSLVVACKKTYSTAKEHDMYTINYVKYEEGGKTIIFDGSSWDANNSKPTGASKDYTIK